MSTYDDRFGFTDHLNEDNSPEEKETVVPTEAAAEENDLSDRREASSEQENRSEYTGNGSGSPDHSRYENSYGYNAADSREDSDDHGRENAGYDHENGSTGNGYQYGSTDNSTHYSYQNSGSGSSTHYGYQNGGSDNNIHYSYQNSSQPSYGRKKKKSPLPVILAILCIIGLGLGAFFGARSFIKGQSSDVNRQASLTTRENQNGGTFDNKETETEKTTEESTKAVSLVKNDSDEIQNADISSGSVVITDVSSVVDSVMPCLVAITDNLEVTQSYNPYNFFFGGGTPRENSYDTVASGTGVIVGENETELLIVTNNHVVDNTGNYTSYSVSSKGLTVQFIDGATADAVVKGTDSDMDLAVVAVDLSGISQETKDAIRMAVIGSSDDIKIGTGVICIGNTLGYGQSVTTGIISAKDREVTIDNITRSLLQTDAAINPGNSGGGMFNKNGELIGINSAKYSDTKVEGMCFAIPISSAQDIIEDLMNREVIPEEEQGYLGINGETVPASYVSAYGYPEGVSITRIQQNSPAETAGLQIYDIITAVNGKVIDSMDTLRAEITSYAAGTEIELTVMRPDGRSFRELTVKATLVKKDEIQISQRTSMANL